MENTYSSETSVELQQIMRLYFPEGRTLTLYILTVPQLGTSSSSLKYVYIIIIIITNFIVLNF
jgi:hypothetical protein